jgi:hypothetical protein
MEGIECDCKWNGLVNERCRMLYLLQNARCGLRFRNGIWVRVRV